MRYEWTVWSFCFGGNSGLQKEKDFIIEVVVGNGKSAFDENGG